MKNYFCKGEKSFCYNLVPGKNNEVIKIPVTIDVTLEELADLVVDIFECGSTYWCGLDNTTPEWDECPEELPWSQWLFNILLNDKEVILYDIENPDEEETYTLTKEKLLKGVSLAIKDYHFNFDDYDGGDADIVLQLALFDEVIFG